MKKISRAFFAFLFIVGCSSQPDIELPEHIQELDNISIVSPEAEPRFEISLTQTASFGDTDEVVLGRFLTGTAVDNKERVYIADLFQNTVHVYNPDGSFLQSVGREGRGPGEFQRIFDIQVDENFLHVLDLQVPKISIFDLTNLDHRNDYNIAIDMNSNPPSWQSFMKDNGLFYRPNDFFTLGNGTYMILYSDQAIATSENIDGRTYEASVYNTQERGYTEHEILSFPWTGQALVIEQGGISNRTTVLHDVPYKRSSQFDYNNGEIVHGWTDEFLFKFYSEAGTYQKALYAPFASPEFSMESALAHYEDPAAEKMRDFFQNDDLPDTWPAFDNIVIDDENRLWISRFTENSENFEWLLLKPEGELVATFEWPTNRELHHVKDGFAYAMETDPETGLQELVKYKIEMR